MSKVLAQNTVAVKQQGDSVSIINNKVALHFNLKSGRYSMTKTSGEKIVTGAYFQAEAWESKDSGIKINWSKKIITDHLGQGLALMINTVPVSGIAIQWTASLYNDKAFFVFQMNMQNNTDRARHLRTFYPLICDWVYPGRDNSINYRVLDGNGGASPTKVTDVKELLSFNNAMVKFGEGNAPNILVAGGITYHDFEKFTKITRSNKNLKLEMYAADPVGKLIDIGQTYENKEKFYICFDNQNPFQALEQYASVLKTEQNIKLDYYDFPTECLWYAAFYNTDNVRPKFNNSKGAVEEMDNAIKSGITKYTKVAIRLVPDAYGVNNQQGWWDDKHWGMYNEAMSTKLPHYTAPYLTTESWAKAIIKKGGYPFTYIQSARRSEDFVKQHPTWMLFNDPYRLYYGNQTIQLGKESSYQNQFMNDYSKQWWQDAQRQFWGYDFTDPGFIAHMKEVYANLKQAGIKGIFYDYPETGWAYEGGFEDKYATTAWAYRNIFQLAKDGLEKGALLQERNIIRGSDVALGIISSQRVWADTDGINPEMLSYCGLLWYKNRTVINYDMDSKDPSDALPKTHSDGNRSMLTMTYVTSGRFLLGRSFSQLNQEQLNDLSRTFPYHTNAQSARPLDAFNPGTKYPNIYDFAVNSSWHQLTFYNDDEKAEKTISLTPSGSLNEGGMELDSLKKYYVYDFWNNKLIGQISVNQEFKQVLRAGEARMMSFHAKENHPQFISTNRHIMQGYVDLKEVKWKASSNKLVGVAEAIADDPYAVVIATNGKKIKSCKVSVGRCEIKPVDGQSGIAILTITTKKTAAINWEVNFK
ncbi:MAG: hypothetical protein J7577_06615 [Sphingobacteriaceae bacterium]|nr:hypothetical protein [Sphingobacteriaceae bacterium]